MTGAANFLHVTQPTLSRQLKELEEELGTRLFVRHSHSVSLTPDGMRLRKRAEEVVDMIEKTEAEFAVKEKSVGGEIHIGAGETRVMRHVADVIRSIRGEYPGYSYPSAQRKSGRRDGTSGQGTSGFRRADSACRSLQIRLCQPARERRMGGPHAQGQPAGRAAVNHQTGAAR